MRTILVWKAENMSLPGPQVFSNPPPAPPWSKQLNRASVGYVMSGGTGGVLVRIGLPNRNCGADVHMIVNSSRAAQRHANGRSCPLQIAGHMSYKLLVKSISYAWLSALPMSGSTGTECTRGESWTRSWKNGWVPPEPY